MFFLVFRFIKLFKRFFKDNFFTIIIQILLVIFIWDFLFFLFNSILVTNVFLWGNYFYKIIHSMLFNVIYGIVLFLIFNRSKIHH